MKKSEEEILARDREQQVILDSVPVSIFHIDSDGTFVHVNEVLAERYGLKPKDFKGKSSRDLFPKVAEEYIKSDKEVIESGEPQIGAIRKIKTPQGVRWVRLDKVPLKDAEGNVTGIIGFELDITRLKRIEEKLQEREREYQTVLDTVPVGIYHIDADSRFIHVNKALAERYGMTPQDFKGKTSRALFPDVGEEYLESDKEVLESGVPQRGVTSKLATPEGVKWVRLDKVPLQDADGNITDIVGFELDITERIKTQEELRNAHKKMQDIVEFLPDATFVIDRDMKVIAWNRAIEEMTGIPKEDIIGKGDYEYALPFYGERRPILTDLVFSSDEEIESRYTHVGKKGNTLFAKVYLPFMYGGKGAHLWGIATPLYDPEGNVVGAIESIRDITERKQAEKERDGLLKELEAKNREMGHFTYTVSHDLRSPLVTIQGFTTMLQKDIEQNERERAENDLKYIESAVTKMSALLSDTLELSRIGRVANPPEEVPFGDIVKGALEQTAGELKATQIDVSVAEDFPTVHVDRMRIVEVLVNLITNSIKYRGDQPHLEIEIGYRVDDKDTVFFVKDNGMGIDKSQHEKVFELFYQVDKSGEGTGAGLAIVKRIIEVHGGRIWIESEKGKGCTVCFTLPVSP
ncbi:MAG TPA: PAS domain-containing protein [Desulfobacteria bacterium]|nr:PAS domain-containing protein [Desulfobacteria bacterium]